MFSYTFFVFSFFFGLRPRPFESLMKVSVHSVDLRRGAFVMFHKKKFHLVLEITTSVFVNLSRTKGLFHYGKRALKSNRITDPKSVGVRVWAALVPNLAMYSPEK